MKKAFIFIASVIALNTAQAHISPGVHKGETTDGQACEMTVGRTYFENNTHHPLNERIEITINGDSFLVYHPPYVSTAEKIAYFDHGQFQGVLATATGAKAVVIKMQHTAGSEGPTEFSLITHDYAQDNRQMLTCALQ